MRSAVSRWQANFVTGLALILPAALTLFLVAWLVSSILNVTDVLLIFLPRPWTHERGGEGPLHWYWSLSALGLAVLLISLLGRMARYYVGKKVIGLVDLVMLRIPMLNKIYGAIKQVNEAFSSNQKTSFRQVVLVEFPRPGAYSVGFVTGDKHPGMDLKTGQKLICVFIPTTPNPTSGFLVIVSETEVVKLDMSVADGIKYIVSLGAIAPERTIPVPAWPPTPSPARPT
jgi:uncharacterized membrane protein